jgi:replicative DNA helicase
MNLVYDGIAGKNKGIPFNNCPKLTDIIYGTRKSTYYLYGAETGVGKTKFVRDQHMFAVYDYYKQINDDKKLDVRFLDFSLEITKEENMINAIIRKVYIDHKKYISFKRVMGIDLRQPLTPFEIKLMENTKDYFEEFQKKLYVIDSGVNPTQYHDTLLNIYRQLGTFQNDNGQMSISKLGEYTLHNPQTLVISLFDTINLADTETGQTGKQSIDRISKIAINFRNKCSHTPIIIQQFNADNSDIQRQRHGTKTPMLRDFEDSKRTTKDANVVIGLWDPTRYGEETFSMNGGKQVYDIVQLRSWFVSAHVLKNRNGRTNAVSALRFNGAVGTFEEFPKNMTPMDYANLTKL